MAGDCQRKLSAASSGRQATAPATAPQSAPQPALCATPRRTYDQGMLDRIVSPDGVVFYRSARLADAGVPHAFSTRVGGISPPPFNSMNLGNPNGCGIQDDYGRIWANYRTLQAAVGCGGRELFRVHQVHGAVVARAVAGEPFDVSTKADAIISDDPSRVVSVRVADCVPVLLSTPDGRVVAAVHAGWRGVVSEVVPAALAQLRRLAQGGAISGAVIAAIGPASALMHSKSAPKSSPSSIYCSPRWARQSLAAVPTGKGGLTSAAPFAGNSSTTAWPRPTSTRPTDAPFATATNSSHTGGTTGSPAEWPRSSPRSSDGLAECIFAGTGGTSKGIVAHRRSRLERLTWMSEPPCGAFRVVYVSSPRRGRSQPGVSLPGPLESRRSGPLQQAHAVCRGSSM